MGAFYIELLVTLQLCSTKLSRKLWHIAAQNILVESIAGQTGCFTQQISWVKITGG